MKHENNRNVDRQDPKLTDNLDSNSIVYNVSVISKRKSKRVHPAEAMAATRQKERDEDYNVTTKNRFDFLKSDEEVRVRIGCEEIFF